MPTLVVTERVLRKDSTCATIQNMCSAKLPSSFATASVAVLGFTAKDGTPRAVAVTPYVVNGRPVVTTTLALLTKAKMLRNRPAAALYAGGFHISGDVTLETHRDADWFDANIRDAERLKYPPAASLLGIPLHRRLLWWYVGRVSMTFKTPQIDSRPGSDRMTLTSTIDGTVQITPLPADLDVNDDAIELRIDVPTGPACLLVHHETDGMQELLSLTLLGNVVDGRLQVRERRGSLEAQHPGTVAQVKELRALGKTAKANRPLLATWLATEDATSRRENESDSGTFGI